MPSGPAAFRACVFRKIFLTSGSVKEGGRGGREGGEGGREGGSEGGRGGDGGREGEGGR